MALTAIIDHVDRAHARLITKFRGTTTLPAVLSAVSVQVQEIEDALLAITVVRALSTATSAQLELIGDIIGAEREGSDDAGFRARIRAQILINRRSGEIETLLQILTLLIPGATFELFEDPPATVVITVTDATVVDGEPFARLLRAAKAAGIRLILETSPADDAQMFTFDGGSGLGFGDSTNPATGGQFASAA